VGSTYILLYSYQSICVQNKMVIAAAELQRKVSIVTAEVTSPGESNLRPSHNKVNDLQPLNLNESLVLMQPTSPNVPIKGSVNLKDTTSFNETKHLLEILQKKGVVTDGGSSYESQYKQFRNFTGSQIDSIITAFGVPNLTLNNSCWLVLV